MGNQPVLFVFASLLLSHANLPIFPFDGSWPPYSYGP